MNEEREIDPRIKKASGDFKAALERMKNAQDPMLKEVLRKEALEKLGEAADIAEAVKIQKKTNRTTPSVN